VPLLSKESLYQNTLRRLSGPDFAAPLILTNEDFRFLAQDQASAIGLEDAEVILEPCARDTAPAILTAALSFEETPEALLLVAPSDHLIGDEQAFLAAVRAGVGAAEAGQIVTFGITPDRPETGLGYLRLSATPTSLEPMQLKGFIEKPDADRAAQMLQSGNYLWNGGIFLFRACDLVAAFEAHAPDLLPPCRAALRAAEKDLDFLRLGAAEYSKARSISLDYAVMEKAENISAVPLDANWSDLGSWDTLHKAMVPDADGVTRFGPVTAISCRNTLLRSEEEGLQLVGLGLDGITAVAMRDAVLVADMSRAQEVKQVVTALKAAGLGQAEDYPRFHRPWGWYETLIRADRFQVKRIMVKPGGILSLQSHHHRAEHWVVVAGTARVTVGETVALLAENQSVYIPLGEVHRMENPGKVPMYLIEVQTGTYLGEDDIVRYEDVYNRS
jgi:mannose-1-phosphate guanylyltransferase/mannose-1-phosphate guanylyltransferase/mannose-6-phosphate isomerase